MNFPSRPFRAHQRAVAGCVFSPWGGVCGGVWGQRAGASSFGGQVSNEEGGASVGAECERGGGVGTCSRELCAARSIDRPSKLALLAGWGGRAKEGSWRINEQ